METQSGLEALVNFIDRLEAEIRTLPPKHASIERITQISYNLRVSFAFHPDELPPLPKLTTLVENYVNEQTWQWSKRPNRLAALSNITPDVGNHIPLLMCIASCIDQQAATGLLIDVLSRKRHHSNEFLSHGRRYAASIFNEQLRSNQNYYNSQPTIRGTTDLIDYCNESFAKLKSSSPQLDKDPHMQMTIAPTISWLRYLELRIKTKIQANTNTEASISIPGDESGKVETRLDEEIQNNEVRRREGRTDQPYLH